MLAARQQFGHMRPAPARGQDHQIGEVGLDQHFGNSRLPDSTSTIPLSPGIPRIFGRPGMLRIDIDEQCLGVPLRRKGEGEIERAEGLAFPWAGR